MLFVVCDLSRYLVIGVGVREGCNVLNKIWWYLNKWKNCYLLGMFLVYVLNMVIDDSLLYFRVY